MYESSVEAMGIDTTFSSTETFYLQGSFFDAVTTFRAIAALPMVAPTIGPAVVVAFGARSCKDVSIDRLIALPLVGAATYCDTFCEARPGSNPSRGCRSSYRPKRRCLQELATGRTEQQVSYGVPFTLPLETHLACTATAKAQARRP